MIFTLEEMSKINNSWEYYDKVTDKETYEMLCIPWDVTSCDIPQSLRSYDICYYNKSGVKFEVDIIIE